MSRAPDAAVLSAALPYWPLVAEYRALLGVRRARGRMDPLLRPVARQAGALQAGVSDSDALEPVLQSKPAALPDWPLVADYRALLGMRRARGRVDPLRRPVARQAGALQAGVSGSRCSGAGPTIQASSLARLAAAAGVAGPDALDPDPLFMSAA